MVVMATYPLAFIVSRLDTFIVMESRSCCSLCLRTSRLSPPSRDPCMDEVVEKEEEGGGVRSTRGTILMVVPLVASRCNNSAKSSGPLSRT